jgi:hypothetical protein
MLFAAVHESGVVQVFGRRHEEAIHALRRPASEKRQCTKSREYGTRQCSECYGDREAPRVFVPVARRGRRNSTVGSSGVLPAIWGEG